MSHGVTRKRSTKRLRHTRHISRASPKAVKSPSNSIRYNCLKSCSWSRKLKTILIFSKKALLLKVINKTIIHKSFPPTFLNTVTTNDTFQQCEKQDSFRSYWRVQLLCTKVQAHSSLEPPLKGNQDLTHFDVPRFLMTF